MPLPKPKVPQELTRGLFSPEFIPRNTNLNDLVREAVIPAQQREARSRIVGRITNAPSTPNGVPIPISELEAAAADEQIRNTQERITAARAKLAETRARLDDAITAQTGGQELQFVVSLKGKPQVRSALRKLFGENVTAITYSMYKEMLKARVVLEKQEVGDYAAGKHKVKT